MIIIQQQSLARLEAQIGQLAESTMRKKLGQLSSQSISNFENNLTTHQPPEPSQQSNVPLKNP